MAESVSADSIAEAAAQPASASVDGQSAAQVSIGDQIKAAGFKATNDAVGATNGNGGKRSGWNSLRTARAIPPSSV